MATSWVDAAEAGQLNEEHGTNLVCRYLSFLDNSVVNPGNLDSTSFFPFMLYYSLLDLEFIDIIFCFQYISILWKKQQKL